MASFAANENIKWEAQKSGGGGERCGSSLVNANISIRIRAVDMKTNTRTFTIYNVVSYNV